MLERVGQRRQRIRRQEVPIPQQLPVNVWRPWVDDENLDERQANSHQPDVNPPPADQPPQPNLDMHNINVLAANEPPQPNLDINVLAANEPPQPNLNEPNANRLPADEPPEYNVNLQHDRQPQQIPRGRNIEIPQQAGRRVQLHTLLRRNAETTDRLLNGRLLDLIDQQTRVLALLERRLQE